MFHTIVKLRSVLTVYALDFAISVELYPECHNVCNSASI